MTWSYRVIYRVVDGEGTYAIHEVYYDEAEVPEGVTENPSYPMGETWEEFRDDLNSYNLAMLDPVIGYQYFIDLEK